MRNKWNNSYRMFKMKYLLDTTTVRKTELYTFIVLILLTTVITSVQTVGTTSQLHFISGGVAQSSVSTEGTAELLPIKAVDGNIRTCSRTLEEENPWWRGELEREYKIESVIITNHRLASQAAKLEGAVISVGSGSGTAECGTVSLEQITNEQTIQINCQSTNIHGKYVYITIPGTLKTLGLCEVRVEGSEIPAVPTTTPTVPTTTPTVPTTTPTVPTTTPTVPTTTPTVPNTTPTVPTTTPTVPTTTPTVPTTTPTDPTTTPAVPTTTTTVPTTTPTAPTTTPAVPTTTPTVPTTTPTVPTTTPTVPTTTPTEPTTTPTVPTTTPTVPTTTPTVPTTTPTVPTTTPTVPTTTPTVPTTAPTAPTTTPTVPTTTPTVPTTTPTVPTTTPTDPTTTPTVPTTTPTVPTTTPTVPTTTPTAPTTTPTVPTTTPTVPTTTPTVKTTIPTSPTATPTFPTTVAPTFPPTTPIILTTISAIPTTTPTVPAPTTSDSTNTTPTVTSEPVYLYCPLEATDSEERILTWPQTLVSEYVGSLEKCADYSSKAGEPKGFRQCSLVENVAQWETPITNECFDETEINGRIERLARIPVTSENVVFISSDLVFLTEDLNYLDRTGLVSSADVLETITTMGNHTSESVTTNVFQIVDNLLEVDQEEFRKAQASNATSTKLLMALETEITMIRNNGSEYTFEGENILIMIQQLPRHAFVNGLNFTSVADRESDYERNEAHKTAIYLPEAILNFIEDDMIGVSFVIYEDDKLFQSSSSLEVGGKIISASVSNAHVVGLPTEQPVVTSFSTQHIGDIDRQQQFKGHTLEASPQCVFWNLSASNGVGDWSTDGCSLASYNGKEVVCHCNHLTNFAVLLDLRGGEVHNLTLDLVSKIGCAISIAALIITILTYLNIRNLRTKQPQRILLHLSFSLLGLYSVFLVGIEQTHSYYGCIVVAGLIHYFTLTSTCWMSVEAVNMYLIFVRVLNSHVSHFLLKASAFAWGMPLVIVALVAGLDHTQYFNDHHCFLRPGVVFSFAVILVVILLLMFNFFIFVIVIHRLTCGRKGGRTNTNMVKEGMKRLQHVLIISLLLGLTWTFGFLTAIESTTFELQLVFCIFNSLQGLFIFLLFCVRQKEVRLAWRAWFTGLTTGKMSLTSSYLSSRKRSSALSLTKNVIYRTQNSQGNLNVSLGNLSHISAISSLQIASVTDENNVIT